MAKAKLGEHSKIWAFVGVFFSLLGFLLVLIFQKKDKYAMYYAKHGLALFLFAVVISVLAWIPVLGYWIDLLGSILLLIAWIVSIVYAFSGEQKKIPLVTDVANIF
jgi:uncharacterized membrane protein